MYKHAALNFTNINTDCYVSQQFRMQQASATN